MQYSSGIIPYRIGNNGVLEFFVGHPTGSGSYWAYLKGGIESGEDEKDAALREFQEESGQNLPITKEMLVPLGKVLQRKGKTVIAFGVEYGDIDSEACFSNFVEGTTKPEIDKYEWMTFEKLKSYTHPKHIGFYEKIIATY